MAETERRDQGGNLRAVEQPVGQDELNRMGMVFPVAMGIGLLLLMAAVLMPRYAVQIAAVAILLAVVLGTVCGILASRRVGTIHRR